MKNNLHYAILLVLMFILFKYTVLEWAKENIESIKHYSSVTEYIFQEKHVASSYMVPFSSLFFPSFLHQQVLDNFFFFLFVDDIIYFSFFCYFLIGLYLVHYSLFPLHYVKPLHDVQPGKKVKKKVAGKTPPEYPNSWYHVVYSDELKAGEVKGVEMLGRRLVIYRTADAPYQPVLLDAFCVHLGADLSEGGKVKGDCIECPFHGWQFDPSGKCVSIAYQSPLHSDYVKAKSLPFPSSSFPASSAPSPSHNINNVMEGVRDRRKSKQNDKVKAKERSNEREKVKEGGDIPEYARMRVWPIKEVNGRVFVWYHAGNQPPEWEPPYSPPYNGSAIFHGRSSHTVSVHIQDIPENGADSAHLFHLHPPFVNYWMGKLMHLHHHWNTDWIPGNDPATAHTAFCDLRHHVVCLNRWFIPGSQISVKVNMIGPSLVHIQFQTLFGRIYAIQTITPLEPELQLCLHDIWSDWTVPRPFAKLALRSIIVQFERDIIMWNAKTHQHRPMLVKGDGKIMQFRRWFSQFYSKESYEPIQPDPFSW